MPTTTVRTTVVTQGPSTSFISVQRGFISTISGLLTALEMVGGVRSRFPRSIAASSLLFRVVNPSSNEASAGPWHHRIRFNDDLAINRLSSFPLAHFIHLLDHIIFHTAGVCTVCDWNRVANYSFLHGLSHRWIFLIPERWHILHCPRTSWSHHCCRGSSAGNVHLSRDSRWICLQEEDMSQGIYHRTLQQRAPAISHDVTRLKPGMVIFKPEN